MPNYNNAANQYQSGWDNVSYDASGNLLNDTFNAYTWDGYNQLASANGEAITNDALGRMVENHSGANQFVYSPMGGSVLASMNGQSLGTAIIPLPGGATAVYNASGLIQYNHPDWLGSARLFSTPSQTPNAAMAYAPFGEGYAGGQQWIQFTSTGFAWTVADTENQSGSLEDFMFRRYSPTQGRWISPDPAGMAAANPANPQTWNRYAYVMNNPLNYTDPSGLQSSTCFINPRTGTCFQGFTNGADPSVGQCQVSIDGGGDIPCDQLGGLAGSIDSTAPCSSTGCPQVDPATGQWQMFYQYAGTPNSNCPTFTVCVTENGFYVNLEETLPFNAANNCQAPFLCNSQTTTATIGPPKQWTPAKQPSALSNYVAFLGCEYNSVVETITDEEDGQGWTAYGFINAGAILALRSGAGATGVGLVFVGTAGAMDVGAMAKANQECTGQIYH